MAEVSIDTAFDAALNDGKINGAIICATDSRGQFTYEKLLGERTLLSGEKQPHQLDDVCCLASATKLMAAVAALQCVEDGLLSLTDDLSTIVPELAAKQVLTGFSEDGKPILEPPKHHITLEMLLTHSSGLAYHFINPNLLRLRKETTPAAGTDKKLRVEELFKDPLIFQPGTGWMYSPGLDFAGLIIERITKQPLIDRMQQRIFTPLDITEVQFYPVTSDTMRAKMVDLNPSDPEGSGKAVTGGDTSINLRTSGAFGGHGLFMTPADYLKVLHSLLANDSKLLNPETVNSMFENHLTSAATSSLEAALAGPVGPHFRVGTELGSKAGYGMSGLLTLEDVEGWYGSNTLTWGGGLTFAWFIDRKNDLCGVGAVQASLPTDGQVVAELKQVFRRDIYRIREARSKA